MRGKRARSFGSTRRATSCSSFYGARRSWPWLMPFLAVVCMLYGLVLLRLYRDGFDNDSKTIKARAGVLFRKGTGVDEPAIQTIRQSIGGTKPREQSDLDVVPPESAPKSAALPISTPRSKQSKTLHHEFATLTPSPSPSTWPPTVSKASQFNPVSFENQQANTGPPVIFVTERAKQQHELNPTQHPKSLTKTAMAKDPLASVHSTEKSQSISPIAHRDPEPPTLDQKGVNDPHAPIVKEKAVTKAALASPSQRIDTVAGYEATLEYLENYPSGADNLYLLFICSDDKFEPLHWSTLCEQAEAKVFEVFANSSSTNQLLVIYAGSEKYWNEKNPFRMDPNLRLKTVPAVMKWHGNGRTSGMLNANSVVNGQFLEYLFGNEAIMRRIEERQTSLHLQIDTLKSIAAYNDVINQYDKSYPLYLVFISGRLKRNNRLWCPYCRYTHLPLELGFLLHAQPKSRLVRIEVADTYSKWKNHTPFHDLPKLNLRWVPAFYSVHINGDKELDYTLFEGRLDNMDMLQSLFAPQQLNRNTFE